MRIVWCLATAGNALLLLNEFWPQHFQTAYTRTLPLIILVYVFIVVHGIFVANAFDILAGGLCVCWHMGRFLSKESKESF